MEGRAVKRPLRRHDKGLIRAPRTSVTGFFLPGSPRILPLGARGNIRAHATIVASDWQLADSGAGPWDLNLDLMRCVMQVVHYARWFVFLDKAFCGGRPQRSDSAYNQRLRRRGHALWRTADSLHAPKCDTTH